MDIVLIEHSVRGAGQGSRYTLALGAARSARVGGRCYACSWPWKIRSKVVYKQKYAGLVTKDRMRTEAGILVCNYFKQPSARLVHDCPHTYRSVTPGNLLQHTPQTKNRFN